MKLGNFTLLLMLGLCMPAMLYAQPATSPGPGFEWVKTGDASYIASGATVPTSPATTTFGTTGDTDPADCSVYCSGNCDGDGLLEKLVFGSTSLPASSCEQRAINLSHWNNPNPESGVSAGATSGTVYLPTAAQVEIVGSGTRITGFDNKGFIIGGNGPGNFSEFDTRVDYWLNWHVDDYSLTGGTGLQMQQFTWNWGEPGGGAELEMSGWNNYSTASFETSDGEVLTVPLASLVETGGNMEIIFEGNMEMFLSRNYGNADGKVQTVPSLEGEASYTINYDVWEIQASLPVEFTSFDGRYRDGTAVLSWTTATEVNSDRFVVERATSSQLRDWQQLGEVAAAGDSREAQTYSFVDERPRAGTNYYRLRQIDKDGTYMYSNVLYLTASDVATTYTLYPNPAGNQIVLQGQTDLTDRIVIVDQNGRAVYTAPWQPQFDVSDLAPGLYALSIVDANGALRWSQRFAKL